MKTLKKFIEMIKNFINTIAKIFHPETPQSKLWAEREIEIACKCERGDDTSNDWDYGCACYESAFRAYQSLLKDGHSGISIGFTKDILNRLIDQKPLTPIEDTEDDWSDISKICGKEIKYQSKRMSSLFKSKHSDGTVTYKDIDAYIGVDLTDNSHFHSSLVDKTMFELYPITMPYYPPTKPTKVYCEDALSNRKNGDFDTRAIHYAIKPDGERIDIEKFFKEPEDGGEWQEITRDEFDRRVKMSRIREENDNLING